jgi:hypothetical protein
MTGDLHLKFLFIDYLRTHKINFPGCLMCLAFKSELTR